MRMANTTLMAINRTLQGLLLLLALSTSIMPASARFRERMPGTPAFSSIRNALLPWLFKTALTNIASECIQETPLDIKRCVLTIGILTLTIPSLKNEYREHEKEAHKKVILGIALVLQFIIQNHRELYALYNHTTCHKQLQTLTPFQITRLLTTIAIKNSNLYFVQKFICYRRPPYEKRT